MARSLIGRTIDNHGNTKGLRTKRTWRENCESCRADFCRNTSSRLHGRVLPPTQRGDRSDRQGSWLFDLIAQIARETNNQLQKSNIVSLAIWIKGPTMFKKHKIEVSAWQIATVLLGFALLFCCLIFIVMQSNEIFMLKKEMLSCLP